MKCPDRDCNGTTIEKDGLTYCLECGCVVYTASISFLNFFKFVDAHVEEWLKEMGEDFYER